MGIVRAVNDIIAINICYSYLAPGVAFDSSVFITYSFMMIGQLCSNNVCLTYANSIWDPRIASTQITITVNTSRNIY